MFIPTCLHVIQRWLNSGGNILKIQLSRIQYYLMLLQMIGLRTKENEDFGM